MWLATAIRKTDMPRKHHKKDKKKKEKIVWYDDNSTIADMSAVGKNGRGKRANEPEKPRSTFKDKWNTYWRTVSMMIVPTMIVLGVLVVLYLVIMLVTGGFNHC